jgi:hypothetical protein
MRFRKKAGEARNSVKSAQEGIKEMIAAATSPKPRGN